MEELDLKSFMYKSHMDNRVFHPNFDVLNFFQLISSWVTLIHQKQVLTKKLDRSRSVGHAFMPPRQTYNERRARVHLMMKS